MSRSIAITWIRYLGQAGVPVVIDLVMVALFIGYLVSARRLEVPA